MSPEAIFQRAFGLSDAEMEEGDARRRARAAERADALGWQRSPWIGRVPVNQHSTLNYAQTGVTAPHSA